HNDAVPPALQRCPEHGFGGARAVDVGRVEEIHAAVERKIDHPPRGGRVILHPEGHRAEARAGHREVRMGKSSRLHQRKNILRRTILQMRLRLRRWSRAWPAAPPIIGVVFCAGFYGARTQPPERLGAFVARTPMPAMIVLPFETLWKRARAGALQP